MTHIFLVNTESGEDQVRLTAGRDLWVVLTCDMQPSLIQHDAINMSTKYTSSQIKASHIVLGLAIEYFITKD